MIENANEQQRQKAIDVGQHYVEKAINAISKNLGVSPLTAATILYQESYGCLLFLGGDATRDFITEKHMAFEAGDTPNGRHHIERGRVAFEEMANHFDLLTIEPEGKA